MRRHEIVLIGPVGAGKSTVAEILAQRLDSPHAMLDRVTWTYAEVYGYGSDAFAQVDRAEGFLEADRRQRPTITGDATRAWRRTRGSMAPRHTSA